MPVGILDANRWTIVDLDELMMSLQTCNRHIGKSFVGVRITNSGFYNKSQKYTGIASIMANGNRFFILRAICGTTAADFFSYIQAFLATFGPEHPRLIFMWDNFRSHISPATAHLIHANGHRNSSYRTYLQSVGLRNSSQSLSYSWRCWSTCCCARSLCKLDWLWRYFSPLWLPLNMHTWTWRP